jgi:eukaryotic-like serine/threonine-protein kinase
LTSPRFAAALADRYTIERELGAGGMATVYLAHDLKHDRRVALKVLKRELAAVIGAERFLAEIRTTANLQHPHILPLHDSGTADGTVFYVMPFVDGESLRDRLRREKQLPVADAVRIAGEVAGALDYAHRHGVIHRDIKPENILLHDGRALVADFGIALAVTSAGTRMTETGLSLGTPHYMSPEQAMGERDLDARSDVYALGCVLYEMLAGEPPFTGPTAQAIVAKVLTAAPETLTTYRKSVPPHVERAVHAALEKLPADRFATTAAFAEALVGGSGAMRSGSQPIGRARARLLHPATLLGALAVTGVLATWGWLRATPHPAVQSPSRLAIIAPGLGGSGGPGLQRQIALTPSGDAVLFVAVGSDGVNRLMRQPLDADEAAPIPGAPPGLSSPVVSPDGQWLLGNVMNREQAFRHPVMGGSWRQLPTPLATPAAAWDADGVLWFSPNPRSRGIARFGRGDSIVVHPAEEARDLQIQQILPDSRTAIVVRKPPGTAVGPALLFDLRSGAITTLLDAAVVEARYVAGYVVMVMLDGSLQAIPFNARRLRVLGEPTTIATGVSVTGAGIAQLAAAQNGTIAFIPEEPRSLVLVDRDGRQRSATPERRSYHGPQFSPDGRRIAVDLISGDGRDVWILSIEDGTLSRATFDRDGHDPTWTPDGRYITYTSSRSGPVGIYRKRPGSAEASDSLLASDQLAYTGIWLRDGSALVTAAANLRPGSQGDIGIVRNGGRGPIEPLVASPYDEQYPALSPDERWLAFVSSQSGRQEVYVRPFDRDGDQVQVSSAGGNEPVWGRDGRELFYRGQADGGVHLIAASVQSSSDFAVRSRRILFSLDDMIGTNPHANYDLSPDGRTFAMVRRSPSTRIVIIQNLPALVERMRGRVGASAGQSQ